VHRQYLNIHQADCWDAGEPESALIIPGKNEMLTFVSAFVSLSHVVGALLCHLSPVDAQLVR